MLALVFADPPGGPDPDPGAAPLTLVSHNGQGAGQLFNKTIKKKKEKKGGARLLREKRIREA